MTQNEVDIIKNSVIDATEAYVEARLDVLDFVKTQIGVTVGNPEKRSDKNIIIQYVVMPHNKILTE